MFAKNKSEKIARFQSRTHLCTRFIPMKKYCLLILFPVLFISGCSDDPVNPVNLAFNAENDIQLGGQLDQEIRSNPSEYPLLDETEYADAYAYLQNLCDQVVNSGELEYEDDFVWKVHIIHDDNVLNAFAAPGGYLYFYTGLIKYLDEEDDLMGVMGHEVAHADKRHSAKQMLRAYGVQVLLAVALGEDPSQLETILAGLAGQTAILKFSRDAETEADEASVDYLAQTPYRCDGASVFFQKLEASGQGSNVPTFLSTHPSPEDRVENIQNVASEKGCSTEYYAPESYEAFKAMLP